MLVSRAKTGKKQSSDVATFKVDQLFTCITDVSAAVVEDSVFLYYLIASLKWPLWPPGRPRMKTVLNDLESDNLTLTEAVNVAQNRPL